MYFISKNSLYSHLMSISNPIRYLITFLFLSSIFFIWFNFFYLKFKYEQNILNNEIANLKKKEILLNQVKQQINEIYLDIKDRDQKIDNTIDFQMQENDDSFEILIKNSKLLNLIITSFNFDNYVIQDNYSKSLITFNFKATFEQALEFFRLMSLSKQWLKFKKINISNDNDQFLKIETICKFYVPRKGIKWQSREF